jgi:RNA polymerase sigma-70 factor (ECF subfamily)
MDESPVPGPRQFEATQWSLVGAAQSDEASRTMAREALEKLCGTYWYPLYAYLRSRGQSTADAQDLTQAFFAKFIETGGFAAADRGRGRFRSYLLGAMKHFLTNEWNRARTRKRGGGRVFLEWDALAPEQRYALEPEQGGDPDARFDREWALELINRATGKLRSELEGTGKGEQFEALKGCLTGEDMDRSVAADRLGMSEGAVKVAVHRLRQRYRELLRGEIAETVAERSDIDEEMGYLVTVLRGK